MSKLVLPVLIALLIIGCGTEDKTARSSLDYIPENSFALIKINNLTAFNSDLKNNHFLGSFKESAAYQAVSTKLRALQYVQSNSLALLAFYEGADDQIHFLFTSPYEPELFLKDKVPNLSKETLTYNGQTIEKYGIDGQTLFGARADSHFLLSSSDSLLKVAYDLPAGMDRPDFNSLYATANPERNATLFVHLGKATGSLPGVLQAAARETLPGFSEWISLDFGSQQDYLSFTGIAVAHDSLPNYVELFANAGPMTLVTPSMAPETSLAVIAFALEDQRAFSAARELFTGKNEPRDSLFHTVEEIGVIHDKLGKVVLLNTYGSDQLSQFLNSRSNGSFTYQDHDIYTLDNDTILVERFSPLLKEFKANYYTILENALLFSGEREALINLLDHYKMGTTFHKTPLFTVAKNSLSDEANILLVANEEGINLILEEVWSDPHKSDFKRADLSEYAITAQLVSEGSFSHTTLMLKRMDASSDDRPTAPWYTVQLDAPIATKPQFVVNHRTQRKEIVVQDEDNQLYLIGTEGKVLWKKALNGRIQGSISQVDLYRNGRLQLAFTTDNQFLVLDRNGKVVAPFSMNFEGGNLNPLAVFDYDNNRNYRFVVTQGRKVYMYDRQGKKVRGFTYTESESPILPSPQHIRLGNRDYLLFRLEDGTLKILNRVGQTRIKVDETINFSGNGVYAYNNQFALTDKSGMLYMIDEKGKIAKTDLNLSPDHGLETTSKSMAFMNDNLLNIKGKEVRLDFGVYTAPKIFYIYDKIYVSVTDLQSGRCYLFDSNAQPIPGFPVSGYAEADLGDMDNDRRLELVTRQQENTLIVYRLN